MDHGKLARLHGALANEVRLRVIDLVSQHNAMCLCELVDLMGMGQANLSRHVSVLRDAEILRDRKVGTWVLLRVDEDAIRSASAELVDRIRLHHRQSSGEDAARRLEARALCPAG
jgi:ArsR family transcriptional regulator